MILPNDSAGGRAPSRQAAPQLKKVLDAIGRTSEQIDNIWEGSVDADKYLAMLRASIERAESIASELVAQGGEARISSNVPTVQPASSARRRVLVVDDEPQTRALLRTILGDAGYDVTCAHSGFQCLDLVGRAPTAFEVVLLDLAMPFMDGAETFARLRVMSPTARIVLTTASVDKAMLAAMQANGLAAFLRKPFAPADVIACLGNLLSQQIGVGGTAVASS